MFGEVVNKLSNWVSSTPKTTTFFNKSIPQSIKGTIRSSNNSASGRKKDLIPTSISQNVDQEKGKIQNRFLTSYCGKELTNPQAKTQIREDFLNIRTKVEKNSVNYYSKLPGIKYNIKFKDDNCSQSNCASDDPPSPKKKSDSSCKKGTKSQCSKPKLAGNCSKKNGCLLKSDNVKKEKTCEKNKCPSKESESSDLRVFSPGYNSHPVRSKDLINPKSRIKSAKIKNEEKKGIQSLKCSNSKGPCRVAPPSCSQSKELTKECSKGPKRLLSKSSCKSSCEGSKDKRLLAKKSQPICCKSSCEERKGKSLLGKKSQPSCCQSSGEENKGKCLLGKKSQLICGKSSCEEKEDKRLLAKKSQPICQKSSCEESKSKCLLAKKSQSICRKSTCEKSKDKCHQAKKPQFICHQKKRKSTKFKIIGVNKPENQCSEPRGPWRFSPSPGSHPVQSKELVEPAPCSNEQICLSAKSSYKTSYGENKDVCPKESGSKEKTSDRGRSSFKNWRQEIEADTTWLFSPGPNSHPVPSKELLKRKNLLSDSCIKPSIDECKERLPMKKQKPSVKIQEIYTNSFEKWKKTKKLVNEKPSSKVPDPKHPCICSPGPSSTPLASKELDEGNPEAEPQVLNFENWKKQQKEEKRTQQLQISDPKESWIFSPGLNSHPVESKEFLKATLEKKLSETSFESAYEEKPKPEPCLEFRKTKPLYTQEICAKINKSKKKEMYAAFANKIILPKESDLGGSWIFTPSSNISHPVSSKEYLLKTLKEPPPDKCKSVPSFATVGKPKSRPICLEEKKPQTVTFDKWKRKMASSESWIFTPGQSSHPVQSKEFLSRDNVVKKPDVFDFKSTCEPCSKDLATKLAERSKRLEEEKAALQPEPQTLFNFEATCAKFKKPGKDVKIKKKKKKKERKPKYELKSPKIDLESLVSELALLEGVEPFENFTTYASCCCRRPRDEFKLDVKKLRPSTSAVKNQVSKYLYVPKNLNEEYRTICPAEEEVCFEKTTKFQKPRVQKIFPKHKLQSDWKKQKYALQLRIYNCSTKYGDPRPLDPCRPLLKEAGCL